MTTNSDMPLWMKALSWAQSIFQAGEKQSAIRRDARLKQYTMELSWIDTTRLIKMEYDVLAENEAQARQLSNAQAAKEAPVIDSLLEDRKIVPPYMKDATAALSLWKVRELPISEGQLELARQGQLGPARTSELRSTLVQS